MASVLSKTLTTINDNVGEKEPFEKYSVIENKGIPAHNNTNTYATNLITNQHSLGLLYHIRRGEGRT